MKTITMRRLLVIFEEVHRFHVTDARVETRPEQQLRAQREAHKVSVMLDAFRGELSVREADAHRSVDEARRAEDHLQGLLQEFLDLGDADRKTTRASLLTVPRGMSARTTARVALSASARNPQGCQGRA